MTTLTEGLAGRRRLPFPLPEPSREITLLSSLCYGPLMTSARDHSVNRCSPVLPRARRRTWPGRVRRADAQVRQRVLAPEARPGLPFGEPFADPTAGSPASPGWSGSTCSTSSGGRCRYLVVLRFWSMSWKTRSTCSGGQPGRGRHLVDADAVVHARTGTGPSAGRAARSRTPPASAAASRCRSSAAAAGSPPGTPRSAASAYTCDLYRCAIGFTSAAPSPFLTKKPWSYSSRFGVPVTA